MSKEIIKALEQMGSLKNIDKKVLISALESALLSASKKVFGETQNIRVEINEDKGEFKIFSNRKVVSTIPLAEEVLLDASGEIKLEDARKINSEAKIGDYIDVELPTESLGRIAAQIAKQVMIQKVRDAEKNSIYEEFKYKEGAIISGVVLRKEDKDIIIDIGNAEGLLPYNEQMFKEILKNGDRIKVYCVKVRKESIGYQVILSRTHPGLLKRLLEIEIPEIASGVVEVKSVAREPGYRAKVAVISKDKNVDPVGACIGMKSGRIQSIIKELQGEKIDVIEWNEDPKIFIATALSPASILDIKIEESERKAYITVSDGQLSLAIGKKGQNARLSAKLCGWKIDIKSETKITEEKQKSVEVLSNLKSLTGVSDKIIDKLVDVGFVTLAIISDAEISELIKIPGVGEKIASKLKSKAKELIEGKLPDE